MDDSAVVQRCLQWLEHYEHLLPLAEAGEVVGEQFKWEYQVLTHLAEPLIEAAKERDLFSWPIESFSAYETPPNTPIVCIDVLTSAQSAIALLLRVAEAGAPSEKRLLVALIYRFLHEVAKYFLAAQSISIHNQSRRPRTITLQEMHDALQQVPARLPPSAEELEELSQLMGKQGDARNALAATGNKLAAELMRHSFDAKGVLRVVHCADGGGGGPEAVSKIWADVKIELQQVLIQVKLSVPATEPSPVGGFNISHLAQSSGQSSLEKPTQPNNEQPPNAEQQWIGSPVIPVEIRANDFKLFPKGPLSDRDLTELVVALNTHKNSGKSLNQIAREYYAGTQRNWRSRLASVRRLRTEGRANF